MLSRSINPGRVSFKLATSGEMCLAENVRRTEPARRETTGEMNAFFGNNDAARGSND